MESPQAILHDIYENHSLSETQIVAELAELGVQTSQPTINRIRRGVAGPTRGELALLEGLLQLRKQLRSRATPGPTLKGREAEGSLA